MYILYQNAPLPWCPWHQDWSMNMELHEKWDQTAYSKKNMRMMNQNKIYINIKLHREIKKIITLIFTVSPLEVSTKSFVSVTVCIYNPSRQKKKQWESLWSPYPIWKRDLLNFQANGLDLWTIPILFIIRN